MSQSVDAQANVPCADHELRCSVQRKQAMDVVVLVVVSVDGEVVAGGEGEWSGLERNKNTVDGRVAKRGL
jgi:hypothetical protein